MRTTHLKDTIASHIKPLLTVLFCLALATISTVLYTNTNTTKQTPTNNESGDKSVDVNPDKNPDTNTEIKYQAWMYPGEPACTASQEIADGRKIDVLKPEYISLEDDGSLKFILAEDDCNGFSKENLDLLKKHSSEQFVTVSGHLTEMVAFFSNQKRLDSNRRVIVDFVVENAMTGVELDFEDFSAWSTKNYGDYLDFVSKLGTDLNKQGKKLMIDGPAIANTEQQGWYKWKYEDFNNLPVNYLVVMTYDYQADQGAGEPVTPIPWLIDSTNWVKEKIPDHKRIVIGLPSYGYSGIVGGFKADILTKQQMEKKISPSELRRDSESHELKGSLNGTVYILNDTTSMDNKLTTLKKLGIKNVSVWHLGGNDWFSSKK